MLWFLTSALVAACGLILAWREPRRSRRLVGGLLCLVGVAACLWRYPPRMQLARVDALDDATCAAAANALERWGRSPAISPSGPIATLIHLSKPRTPTTTEWLARADAEVKRNEASLVSGFLHPLLTLCVVDYCDEGSAFIDFVLPPDSSPERARTRGVNELAITLRTRTCPRTTSTAR